MNALVLGAVLSSETNLAFSTLSDLNMLVVLGAANAPKRFSRSVCSPRISIDAGAADRGRLRASLMHRGSEVRRFCCHDQGRFMPRRRSDSNSTPGLVRSRDHPASIGPSLVARTPSDAPYARSVPELGPTLRPWEPRPWSRRAPPWLPLPPFKYSSRPSQAGL